MNTDPGFPPMVAPTYARTATHPRAARPTTLTGTSIGLVDSMLNPRGEWGRGILDAVEDALRERWQAISCDRIARPQLGVHDPDRWAQAMAARHAALVIAVGD